MSEEWRCSVVLTEAKEGEWDGVMQWGSDDAAVFSGGCLWFSVELLHVTVVSPDLGLVEAQKTVSGPAPLSSLSHLLWLSDKSHFFIVSFVRWTSAPVSPKEIKQFPPEETEATNDSSLKVHTSMTPQLNEQIRSFFSRQTDKNTTNSHNQTIHSTPHFSLSLSLSPVISLTHLFSSSVQTSALHSSTHTLCHTASVVWT